MSSSYQTWRTTVDNERGQRAWMLTLPGLGAYPLLGRCLPGDCKIYPNRYNFSMKPLRFLGDSLKVMQEFPRGARSNAGRQLLLVQRGEAATDFKLMPAIGKGVEEIRVWDESGAYRVIYTARLADAVYVVHAFQKKTQATSKHDIETARKRFMRLMGEGK
jgi:phage-related protein